MSIAASVSARHSLKPPDRSLNGNPSASREALQPARLIARRARLQPSVPPPGR